MEALLNIVLVIVIGGVAGWAATRLFKNDKQTSTFMYVVLGILGAVIGSFVIRFLGFEAVEGGVIVDFITAFIGAVILVGASKFIASKLVK